MLAIVNHISKCILRLHINCAFKLQVLRKTKLNVLEVWKISYKIMSNMLSYEQFSVLISGSIQHSSLKKDDNALNWLNSNRDWLARTNSLIAERWLVGWFIHITLSHNCINTLNCNGGQYNIANLPQNSFCWWHSVKMSIILLGIKLYIALGEIFNTKNAISCALRYTHIF